MRVRGHEVNRFSARAARLLRACAVTTRWPRERVGKAWCTGATAIVGGILFVLVTIDVPALGAIAQGRKGKDPDQATGSARMYIRVGT